MSTFLHLNSAHRDRGAFPNPAKYVISGSEMDGWYKFPRTTRANPGKVHGNQEFVVTVKLVDIMIPYYKSGDYDSSELPFLYIDLHTNGKDDNNLVYSINATLRNIKFVASSPRIITDYDNNPKWVQFYCTMEQQMRLDRDRDLSFSVYYNETSLLPNIDTGIAPDLTKQIYATFSITPYYSDTLTTGNNTPFIT